MLTRFFAILGTTLAFLVFSIVISFDQSQLDISYLHPVYSNFLTFNSKPQVHAHMAMVMSIVLLGFIFVWNNISTDHLQCFRPACMRFVRGLERFYPFVMVCLLFLSLSDRFTTGRDKWIFSFAITMIIVILPRYVPRLRKHGNLFFVIFAVVAVALAAALTLWHPAVFPNWSVSYDTHVGSILTPINQFTAGLDFGKEVYCAYGILLPAVLGLLQKATGWWTLGEQFTLLYVIDLLYLSMSVLAWRIWNNRHVGYLVAAFLLVFPFLYFYDNLVILNHSSLRFFNFALIPLLVLLTRNLPYQSLILGFLTGISFAINIETSIALSCGILAYALTIHPSRSFLKMLSSFLAWLFFATATLLIIVFLLYGDIQIFLDSFMYLFAFSQGFAGLPLTLHTVFCFIAAHAVYTVFRSFILWRRRPLSQRQRFCFFVSTTILIWIAYQMGRYAEVHIETFYSMYAFFLINAIDIRRLRLFWSTSFDRKRFRLSFPLCSALIVIIPTGGYLTLKTVDSYKQTIPHEEMTEWSGITIVRKTADQLQSRIDYLNKTKQEDVLVLTGFSYTIPLAAQYYPKKSFMNLFMESILASNYQKNLQRIFTQKPELIYFDATMNKHNNGELKFYKQVRKDIKSYYAFSETISGWEVWKLRTDYHIRVNPNIVPLQSQ